MPKSLGYPLLAAGTLLTGLCLHEGGHALAAWLTGGRILEIVLFSLTPHVTVAGHCKGAAEAFRAAAGSGSSLTIYFFLTLLSKPPAGFGFRIAELTAFWYAMAEILGWTLTAVFPGSADGNDAAHFLETSGISHGLLAAACLALASMLVFLTLRRMRLGRSHR